MKNFVTYSDAEIRPGPQLNVVIGPNGTGKSTLVCAMVLGLGGKPAVLGRAKEPRDFIKHGETSAIVECELYGGKDSSKNVVIRRKILSDNSSQWKVNGRESNIKEVLDRVHRLNVQVDNLCQFLPQDRVSSFAEMDPKELLKETELAINEQLHQQHDELIKLKKDEVDSRVNVDSKRKNLDELKMANEELRRDVARFKERERLMAELELLESKRPWVAFESSRVRAVDLQKVHQHLLKDLQKAEELLAPLEAEARRRMEATTSGAAEEEASKVAVRNIVTQRAQLMEKLRSLAEKTTGLEQKLDQVDKMEERREAERRRVAKLIEELRKQVALAEEVEEERLKSLDHWKAEHERLKEEEKALQNSGRRLQQLLPGLQDKQSQLMKASKESERIRNVQIHKISQVEPASIRVLQFIDQNRNKFRGEVFGPILLHLKVTSTQYAVWLDKIFSLAHLTGFVFGEKEDRDLVTKWCAENQVPVPTFYYSPDAYSDLKRPLKKAQLNELGLDGYVDSLFDAPDLIRWTLCNVARLHTIPYGSDPVKSESHIEELSKLSVAQTPGQETVRRFITPRNYMIFKPSSYSSNVAISVTPLKPGLKWMVVQQNVDEAAMAKQLVEAQQEIQSCNDEMAAARTNLTQLKPRIEQARSELAKAQHSDIKSLKERLKSAEVELRELSVDVQAQRDSIRAQIITSLNNRYGPMIQLSQLTPKLVEAELKSAELLLKRGFLRSLADRAAEAFNEARATLGDLEFRTKAAEGEFREAREQTRILKSEAQKRSHRTPELEAKWAELPSTLEELDSHIDNNRIRINTISPNRDILDKYEERQRKIEQLEGEIENFDAVLAKKQARIAELKDRWLPEVKKKVHEININFAQFFQEIGCVGEVKLDTSENDAFEKFGIDIWVSYRKTEDPRKLDARVQSGGERSVATMLYLIAIQQLSDCPFRLVDEINQGMDPQNERMIFDQVTNQASKANTPQYFLITPKLLPDLKFTPAVTMLCVFNGPFMTDQKNWVVTAP